MLPSPFGRLSQAPPGLRSRAARWRQRLADLSGAWIFYSVLPAPPWPPPRFERIARFAPWLGLLLGGLQALAWLLSAGALPVGAAVLLLLALELWLSGGLHSDGLMDTADGLAAGPRCLEAMDDSRVGASGVQALVLVLLLRGAALLTLAERPGAPAVVALALVWSAFWARVAPLLAIDRFPYLRAGASGAGGGSAGFHRAHWRGLGREARPALLAALALVALSGWLHWPLQGVVGLLPALLVPWWLGRRLGGHSGDSYGACVEWTGALALSATALVSLLGPFAGLG